MKSWLISDWWRKDELCNVSTQRECHINNESVLSCQNLHQSRQFHHTSQTDLWWHKLWTYSYDKTWKSLTKKSEIHKLLFWIFRSDRQTKLKWVSQNCHITTKDLWQNSQTADRNNTAQEAERICHHVSTNQQRSLIQ